ncbi:MAG: ATPase V [Spirochaetales bacterium]|nr:ATPase V [Spirochaetales bacterium]
MKHLIAVVLDHDVDEVTRELLNLSLLHFVSITDLGEGLSSRLKTSSPLMNQTQILDLKKRIETYLAMIKVNPAENISLDIKDLKSIDLKACEDEINGLSDKMHYVREQQKHIQQEILKLEDIKRQMDLFGDIRTGMKSSSRFSFLNMQTGTIQRSFTGDFETAMAEYPTVVLKFEKVENQTHIFLISLKRDDPMIHKIQDKYHWVDVEIADELSPMKEDVISDLDAKLLKLRENQEKLLKQSMEMVHDQRKRLEELWTNLKLNELYGRIQAYYSKTDRTMLFSGWLPAQAQKVLEKALLKATKNRCYLEWSNPVEMERKTHTKQNVPVKFNNPLLLRPFQMLVQNYDTPKYGTIDPTPFVAVAYLIMFGLMFGDVGHGFILFIAGFFAWFSQRKHAGGTRDLMQLVMYCGLIAIVSGFLFGSYFGMPWFPALWFDFHAAIVGHAPEGATVRDVFGILKITIYFGISVISLGLVLNWVNLVREKKWFNLVFTKGGILGSWMYFAGIWVCFYAAESNFRLWPDGNLLFWIIFLPALLFIIKPPLEFLLHSRKHPEKRFTVMTLVDWAMEWIVEMLEIFSGYLANTLSFMRVAGLGIAHAYMMIAFFQMAQMAAGGPGLPYSIWSYVILVFGNILVIGLEGLSAGIQSLRLNYYEFFSKYFSGSGRAYEPVSLRNRN